jgi:hypothetical protein
MWILDKAHFTNVSSVRNAIATPLVCDNPTCSGQVYELDVATDLSVDHLIGPSPTTTPVPTGLALFLRVTGSAKYTVSVVYHMQ